MRFRHCNQFLSKQVINCYDFLSFGCLKFIHDIADCKRRTNRQSLLKMLQLCELIDCIRGLLKRTKIFNFVEVSEVALCKFAFSNCQKGLLNVTNCLLCHDSIVTFIDWNWTVERPLLWQIAPNRVPCSATIDSHLLNAVVGHSGVKRLQTTCKMVQSF